MGYKKAEEIFPAELIEILQEYVDGDVIYIPKRKTRAGWGTRTGTKNKLRERNNQIYSDYLEGMKVKELASKYYLTDKSVQRIIREKKRDEVNHESCKKLQR